jgi:hypothetical protein
MQQETKLLQAATRLVQQRLPQAVAIMQGQQAVIILRSSAITTRDIFEPAVKDEVREFRASL